MRNLLLKAFLPLLALLPVTGLRAQTLSNASTAFPILSVGVGARAVGMGESFTAVADDLSALHYNPAGLGQISNPRLSLMHNSYLNAGFFETLAFDLPLGDTGTLALGLSYLHYGNIDRRDLWGNLTGTYAPNDLGIRGGFGFELAEDLFLGAASQWMRQDINGSSHASLSWDLGLLLRPFERFTAGLAVKNLGVESGGYNLPSQIKAGAAFHLPLSGQDSHALIFSAGGDLSFQGASRLNAGFEYALQKKYFLRAGYAGDLRDNRLGGVKGLSAGAGVKWDQFQVDYSFSFVGDLGDLHRVSLSVLFPPDERPGALSKPGDSKSPKMGEGGNAPPSLEDKKNPVVLKFKVTSEGSESAFELFEQGEKKLRQGLKREAMDLYLKAVEKDPDFQPAWGRLGKLYFDKSLESYRKVLKKNPGNEKLREWLKQFKE
jgi:hypothetical protein